MKLSDANRPLRVLDKVLQGGLGAGNLGVIMAGHGMGKLAVLTSIGLDHAMDGRNTLHVALGENVGDIRAFHDEVLHGILTSLDVTNHGEILTKVERHKQIYTYRDGKFDPQRLRQTLTLLSEGAEFRPQLVELQGWPDFQKVTPEGLQELKAIATDFGCEMWMVAHTQGGDKLDGGVPDYVARFGDLLSVLISLEPQGGNSPSVRIHVRKAHAAKVPDSLHLEFDPTTQLIRWR